MTKLLTDEEKDLIHTIAGANYPVADKEIELLFKLHNRLRAIEDAIKSNPNDATLGGILRQINVEDEVSDFR